MPKLFGQTRWGDCSPGRVDGSRLYHAAGVVVKKPLEKATPDAVIGLPVGAPGKMTFDAKGNLVVQDHTYNKVWGANDDRDPVWLRALE